MCTHISTYAPQGFIEKEASLRERISALESTIEAMKRGHVESRPVGVGSGAVGNMSSSTPTAAAAAAANSMMMMPSHSDAHSMAGGNKSFSEESLR